MENNKILRGVLSIVCVILTIYSLSIFSKTIANVMKSLSQVLGNPNIKNPLLLYISSLLILIGIVGIVICIFINLNTPIVRLVITVLLVYLLCIGPLVMISNIVLLNVPLTHIAIVFSIMSFIALTFKKCWNFAKTTYHKLNEYF